MSVGGELHIQPERYAQCHPKMVQNYYAKLLKLTAQAVNHTPLIGKRIYK
jgi:hypothetical protein